MKAYLLQFQLIFWISLLLFISESYISGNETSYLLQDLNKFTNKSDSEINTVNRVLLDTDISIHQMLRVRVTRANYFRDSATQNKAQSGWPLAISHLLDSHRLVPNAANILLVDSVCWWFNEQQKGALSTPWIGIIHHPGELPPTAPHLGGPGKIRRGGNFVLKDTLRLETFQQSLKHCKALISLSPSWLPWIARLPEVRSLQIPVFGMLHPLAYSQEPRLFSMSDFKAQRGSWKVVLLGQQHRRISTIFRLNTVYDKVWLPGAPPEWKPQLEERKRKELEREQVRDTSDVAVVRTSSPQKFEQFLKKNIVVLDYWALSVDEALLNCIKLKIPALVRRLPAAEDYLGRDYPLFFENVEDLEALLGDALTLTSRMEEARIYLKKRGEWAFSLDQFATQLEQVVRQVSLPSHTPSHSATEKKSLLVLVPSHGNALYTDQLDSSVELLRLGTQAMGLPFRCQVFVNDRNILLSDGAALKRLASSCSLVYQEGGWTQQLASLPDPLESHVALLSEDVELTTVDLGQMLNAMDTYGFDVVSPAVDGWFYEVMRPRRGCVAHRTDFAEFLFTVFRRPSYLCLQANLDPLTNSHGWGHDLTLGSLCQARIGVLDEQRVTHKSREMKRRLTAKTKEAESPDNKEALKQFFAWVQHALGLDSDHAVVKYWTLVLYKRPLQFPYCQMPVLSPSQLKWTTQVIDQADDQTVSASNSSSCEVQTMPTLKRPFLFFQVPSPDANTMRDLVFKASHQLSVMSFVPGAPSSGVPGSWKQGHVLDFCPYSPTNEPLACMFPKVVACAVVLGGRIGTSLPKAMMRAADTVHPACTREWTPSARDVDGVPFGSFSCLVLLRHPVDLLLTCYEQTFNQQFGPFQQLNKSQRLLVVRMCGDNIVFQYLGGSSPLRRGPGGEELPGFGGNMAVAKRAVDECFVGLTDSWDASTALSLRRAFPWLGSVAADFRPEQRVNLGQSKMSFAAVEALQMLLEQDMEIYRYALKKMEKQNSCYQ